MILTRMIPDSIYLRIKFQKKMGYPLDLKNPHTFNEKLQWLKLYDRNSQYVTMVDKYEAKRYMAEKVGWEYIIPTIGIYSCFDDINKNDLPDSFVIKTTHDSGGVVICKDKTKLNWDSTRKIIEESLKNNYFYTGREWPYKEVPHRIIIEEFLSDGTDEVIDNWKFYSSYGNIFAFYVTKGGGHSKNLRMTYFDINRNVLPVRNSLYPNCIGKIKFPGNLDKMIELAKKLSAGFPFIRVDFYNVNEKIYLGELTFYPGNGWEPIIPAEYDRLWGNEIMLPKKESRNRK